MMMIAALVASTLAASAQYEVGTISVQPKVGFTTSNISKKVTMNCPR